MCSYGPSDQVKTCEKPHDLTSLSASLLDFAMVDVQDSGLVRRCEEGCEVKFGTLIHFDNDVLA